MTKNAMSWIVVALLVFIIILLSICIYLDIEFSAAFTSSSVPDTTVGSTSTEPIINTIKPVTTTATTPPASSSAPSTIKPITTQAPNVTVPPVITSQPPVTSTAPITTSQTPTTTKTPQSSKPTVLPDAPTICIDPGHGFTDPGACRVLDEVLYEEDDINLAIANMLKDELIALGYNVIMTHDGEKLPETKYINDSSIPFNASGRNYFIRDRKSEIDLVVSIHCNTAADTSVTGTRFYILPVGTTGYTSKSITLSEKLSTAVHQALGTTKPNTYHTNGTLAVLKTGVPSVLVESLFMSNNSDLKKLTDPEWQSSFATALAQGVKNYLTK